MDKYVDLAILIISIFTSLIFLLILLYHSVLYFKEQKYKRKKEIWEPILIQYLEGDKTLIETSRILGHDFKDLQILFNDYISDLKGKGFFRLQKLSREIGLTNYFIKNLDRGNKKKKIKAITYLGRLEEKRAIPYLGKEICSKDEKIMLPAVWAVAKIGEVRLFIPVLKVILTRTHMTFEGITELIIHFGRKVCKPIEDIIQKSLQERIKLSEIFGVEDFKVLSLLIDILGFYKYQDAVYVLQQLLIPNQNIEVLIHLFKSLSKMESIVDKDLRPYILHIDWVVRSQAVRYLGIIQDKSYINELETLLSDPKWWVRYYAADTLYEIGEYNLLEHIAINNTESAGICKYILSENRNQLKTG